MMSTNTEKNSAVSEEGHVLTAYGFYLVVSLASMQIKSFWNPFSKINSGLKLKIYIDPSAWLAESAVSIKENRPKGKIVFKKRDLTEKKKRCNETENDVAWSRTRFICTCKPLLDHCTTVTHTIFGRLSTDISNGYLLTIDQVSTDHRPSVDQLLTDTVISAEIHLERLSTDYPPCLHRVSTDYRLSLDRLSTAISTECRPTIDCYIDQ